MLRYRVSPLLLALILAIAAQSDAAELSFRVVDEQDRPVAPAVIWAIAETGATAAAPDTPVAIMDQRNRRFVPHVLVVQAGTAVTFPNSDTVRHQVYSFSPAKRFQLPLYEGTPADPVVFEKPGIVSLGCNIHDRMSAFIVVVATPHFALGDKEGVRLELPAGRYHVHLWTEDHGERDLGPFDVADETITETVRATGS